MSKSGKTEKDARMESGRRFYQDIALKPIGNLVRPYIKKALPKKNIIFTQLFDMWPMLVAHTEAVSSIPEKLVFPIKKQQGAVLHIWAQSGAQAMEISFNKTALIQKINAVFGYAMVADIRVTAHAGHVLPKQRSAMRANPAKVNQGPALSSQSLDKILSGISNPELRSALRDLGGVISASANENPDTHTNEVDNAK